MKNKWSFLLLIFVMSCQAQTAVPEPLAQTDAQPIIVEEVAVDPTAPPEPELPTAVPTIAPQIEEPVADDPAPTATFELEPTEEPIEEEVPVNFMETGRTPLGAYYLGSPDAPIRMIDYSDFL